MAIGGLVATGAAFNGTADTAWEVECTTALAGALPCPVAGFRPAQQVPTPFFEWVTPAAGSSWIGMNDRATLPGAISDNAQRYQYIYRLGFDLTGFDPATVRLEIEWAADNYYGGVRLNTNSFSGALPENRQWTAFKTLTLAAPSATFVNGRNLIELRVLGDGETDGFVIRRFTGTAVRR